MAVAFTPHDKPPRIMRYVESLPDGLLSVLDTDQNILLIARPLFDQLSPRDREEVLRTHAPALAIFNAAAAA